MTHVPSYDDTSLSNPVLIVDSFEVFESELEFELDKSQTVTATIIAIATPTRRTKNSGQTQLGVPDAPFERPDVPGDEVDCVLVVDDPD